MIEASAQIVVNRYSGASQYPEEWDLPALVQDMAAYLPEDTPTEEEIKQLSGSEVANFFYDRLIAYYDKRREAMGAEVLNALEHAVVLQVVDRNWMDHLDTPWINYARALACGLMVRSILWRPIKKRPLRCLNQ